MSFFTTLHIPNIDSIHGIDYQSKIVSIGSCFADNIAQKMDFYKFRIQSNPFGVIFHPLAIENLFARAFNYEMFTEKELIFFNDLWHSFDVHSQCNHSNKEQMLSVLNEKLRNFRKSLSNATHVIITLGTAWVYHHIESDKIVANCHKIPQEQFIKRLIAPLEIYESLQRIKEYIRGMNAYVRIIFTISPVRHLKDGFVENQRSKSLLFTSLHEYLTESKDTMQFYFPAYEIMMDELRDYRFYKEDLIHPSQQAINYIWDKFANAYIKKSAVELMKEVASIQAGLSHRPFQPDSESHKLFLQNLDKRIQSLQEKISFIRFDQ